MPRKQPPRPCSCASCTCAERRPHGKKSPSTRNRQFSLILRCSCVVKEMENGVLALDFFIKALLKATPATSRANKWEHYSRCLPGLTILNSQGSVFTKSRHFLLDSTHLFPDPLILSKGAKTGGNLREIPPAEAARACKRHANTVNVRKTRRAGERATTANR